jgi:hypothetical protein
MVAEYARVAKFGKRDGLKIHCPKGLAGSSPAPGTPAQLDEFYAEHRHLVADLRRVRGELGTIAGLATSLEDRARDLDALIAEATPVA